MGLDAFFMPFESGRRFCLLYDPDFEVPRRGAVVYVHPFAEEMNKSRRMAALQARALARSGYSVLEIDLLGCGDSSGDFADASWERWVDEVKVACDWLRQRREGEFWLWGLRTGGLLAAAVADSLSFPVNLLLWQPVISGKQYLQQFLRLKIAGQMLSSEGKGAMESVRQRVAQGESVEVAGYRLSAAMAEGLERAQLVAPARPCRIEWFELSGKPDGGLSVSAQEQIDKLQSGGHRVHGHSVRGPAFWQTAEIEECPELLEASLRAMARAETE